MSASCSSVAWAVSAHPLPESSDTDDATEAGLQFSSVGRIGPFPSQLKVLKVGQITVAVETVESKAEGGGTQVYAAVEKRGHHRSVEDLERKENPREPEADASTTEKMKHRMKTQEGLDGKSQNRPVLTSQIGFPQNPAAGF